MLCLSRKPGERILIPSLNISIMVTDIRPGGNVRIGIDAPRGVRIVREEVEERRIKEQQK